MAKIGEFYKLKGHEEHLYMLAYVEAVKVASVCVHCGARYDDAIDVTDPRNISEEEFMKIFKGRKKENIQMVDVTIKIRYGPGETDVIDDVAESLPEDKRKAFLAGARLMAKLVKKADGSKMVSNAIGTGI